MPTLSKLANNIGLPVLNTNCYETIHTWTPNCNQAIIDTIPDGILFCLKTYAPFYLVTALVAKKGDPRKIDWWRYLKDVTRSSIFLACNLVLFIFFLCRFRHALGFFTPISMGLISSMCGSFFSLFVEKRSRWPALALYLTNLASETLFRQLSNHGYISKVKNGEVVPFIVGMGLLSYLYTASKLDNSTKKIFTLINNIEGSRDIAEDHPLPKQFKGFLYELRKKYGRTELCEHKHSCISNAAESFCYNFVIGIGVSSAMVLLRNLPILFKNPVNLLNQLFSKSTLRIPTFFGLMPLIFHVIRCSLNRLPWSDTMFRNVAAGTASGFAMLAFPNVSIAMYVMWKAIEIIYFDLVKQGKIRTLPYGDLLLYTVSTGYVLWQIIIEPQAIRKGYLKFLLGLTGNRMSLLNRDLYEHFGYQSRLLFPYRPVLNTKYVTINPMLYQPISPP
ncbi:hypothetical protein ANCCAN_00121 [Ancylostoma caninum]|uniref:Transmembrane protein 135 N-terminal domain-containing protein n=1 Tax=Ancylostoma caninum TaxID=29170 RepID=A0A368HE52_ANCCA|nr:hypothetical protein ANCCAN_00121 [Ancylostoma caninum]